MTSAINVAQSGSPSVSLGFKNRIINGDMRIDQRNAGASVTANSATNPYTTDRWRSFASTGSNQFSIQQSTTAPSGYKNSLVFTSLTATTVGSSDGFGFRQPIEGLNVADLGWGTADAATVTLSFWVRSSLTGTFGGSVANNVPDRSYPFSYTISSVNTWTFVSLTISGDTIGTWPKDNTTGINVWFGLGFGSTKSGAAGTWANADYRSATGATSVVGTNGATFYITGVQLEKGTAATSFEYRDYGRELMMCQRYYQVNDINGNTMNLYPNNNAYSGLTLSVQMRAAPTNIYDTTIANSGKVYFNGTNVDVTYGNNAASTNKSVSWMAARAGSWTLTEVCGHTYVTIRSSAEL